MAKVLFVTGKLAEPALRRVLAELPPRPDWEPAVAVLPITVAALATTPWVARHLDVPPGTARVVLPGLVGGDLDVVSAKAGCPAERGPADLRDLPEYLGQGSRGPPAEYGAYDVEILAEINHAPRLPREELLARARKLKTDGADVIDVGCDPGPPWPGLGDTVRALRDEGLRVSVDSFDAEEVEAAAAAGAELVLSVNAGNRETARAVFERHGCEFVVVPDGPDLDLDRLDETVAALEGRGVRYRIDPVLEPIGFGFAASLGRYLETRRRHPDAAMMMGVGNLTELTDCDSAAVNVVLLGFCQELGIRSVLTTEVINWCRSCVRELDLARRLVRHACAARVLPKRLEPNLVLLRDPKLREHGDEALRELASRVKDRNFRLFAERGRLVAINDKMFLEGADPFELFERMQQREQIDASHAFYLGYEMAKAVTALTLGKNYVQDQALRWGFLTAPEKSHRGPEAP